MSKNLVFHEFNFAVAVLAELLLRLCFVVIVDVVIIDAGFVVGDVGDVGRSTDSARDAILKSSLVPPTRRVGSGRGEDWRSVADDSLREPSLAMKLLLLPVPLIFLLPAGGGWV